MEWQLIPCNDDLKTIIINSSLLLGRSSVTGIKDIFLSKNQCSFEPNFEKKELKVTQLGKLPSKINSKLLNKGESSILKDEDIFMFLEAKHSYIVKLISPKEDKTGNKKRKNSEDNDDILKKQKHIDFHKGTWHEENGLVIYTPPDLCAKEKIASYDIDGTIIITKSGKVFATDVSDWKIIFPEVKSCLKNLHENDFKIVFFTNQNGIEKGKILLADFKLKVENILKELEVPIQVFISVSSGIYRKPSTGMWDYLTNNTNGNIIIDKNKSFYVGDAAGRPKDWVKGMKKDFSCSDRLFAINVGLKFETPEEHFLKQKPAKFNLPDFNPHNVITTMNLDEQYSNLLKKNKEVILLVGFPGSGKSYFAKNYLVPAGYIHVNRDTLKTWQLCVQKTNEALQLNKSVVVDNTNPDKESRQRYVQIAKDAGVPCRCFIMDVSFEHAKHNEKFRERVDKNHVHVSDMVFNIYKSKYQVPEPTEGFESIEKIKFNPKFDSPSNEKLYKQYLLVK